MSVLQRRKRKVPTPLELPTTPIAAEGPSSPARLPIKEVTGGVFISGYSSAANKTALKKHRITHILNLVGDDKCPNLYPSSITYYTLRMRDSAHVQIIHFVQTAVEFIAEALRQGGRVLIHCAMGRSRAPTIASAYLMWAEKLSFETAFAQVQQVQPQVQPNLGFFAQLQRLEVQV